MEEELWRERWALSREEEAGRRLEGVAKAEVARSKILEGEAGKVRGGEGEAVIGEECRRVRGSRRWSRESWEVEGVPFRRARRGTLQASRV